MKTQSQTLAMHDTSTCTCYKINSDQSTYNVTYVAIATGCI